MFFTLFIYFLLSAGSADAALPVLFLPTSKFWGFSPRRGDTVHVHHGTPIKVIFGREERTVADRRGADRTLNQNTRGHFLAQRCKRTAIEIFQTHALLQIPLLHFPPPALPCRIFHSHIFSAPFVTT